MQMGHVAKGSNEARVMLDERDGRVFSGQAADQEATAYASTSFTPATGLSRRSRRGLVAKARTSSTRRSASSSDRSGMGHRGETAEVVAASETEIVSS